MRLNRRVGLDPSARAFAVAARLADTTQIVATNNLVLALKQQGLWSLLTLLYPFVGGTATAHSLNLKDVAQYPLIFAPGTTHDQIKGMLQANNAGTSSLAVVQGYTAANFDISNYAMGVYFKGSLTNRTPVNEADITVVGGTWTVAGLFRNVDNQVYLVSADWSTYFASPPRGGGLNVTGSQGTNQFNYYRNGVFRSASNRGSTPKPSTGVTAKVGCNSLDGTTFAFFGNALTTPQHVALYNAIQAFQTALGRAV